MNNIYESTKPTVYLNTDVNEYKNKFNTKQFIDKKFDEILSNRH